MPEKLAINCSVRKNKLLAASNIMVDMSKAMSAKEILATNILALRKYKQWSQRQLAHAAGVSQRTISNIEKQQDDLEKVLDPNYSPTVDAVEKIAGVFGLSYYHIMMPLPLDELLSLRIEKVAEWYVRADQAGRENIARVAEMAAGYKPGA